MLIEIIISVIIGYLIGSIPFSFIIGKFRGVDIRKKGDNNIGATNVFRNVGKLLGVLSATFDILKGLIPLIIAFFIFNIPEIGLGLMGMALIIGHIFPIYLKFKGGKGIATTFGVSAFFLIWYIVVVIGLWFLIFFVFKKKTWYLLLWTLPLLALIAGRSLVAIIFLIIIVIIIYVIYCLKLSKIK